MTSFERTLFERIGNFKDEVLDRLGRIETKIDNTEKALYGNGKPGLLEEFDKLEDRVRDLETKQQEKQKHYGAILTVIAFIINAAIAFYAVVKK